jgi:hypothetical protein
MRNLVIHIKHFAFGANILFGIAMTIEAEPHREGLRFRRELHLFDARVALVAADALVHMDTVVEVNEFGQVGHLGPHDGLVLLVAIADRLEQGAIGPDLGVACHTDLCGRDARMGRLRNGPVAIAAIDAQLLGVVFVAEGNRLVRRLPRSGPPRRTGDAGTAEYQRH